MKSKILSFSLALLIAISGIAMTACAEKPDTLTPEYKALKADILAQAKKIKRAELSKFKADTKTKFEALLKKVEAADKRDSHKLLKGYLLLDLDKGEEAKVIFDDLIKNNSKLISDAKMGKVMVLLKARKVKEAFPIFKEIEDKIAKDYNYINAAIFIAFTQNDVSLEYAKKVIAADKEGKYEEFKSYAYSIIIDDIKAKGDKEKTVEALEKALADLKDEKYKKRLQGTLKQLKMVNAPAPDFPAKDWINTKKVKGIADLKGKVVILDFFAPWCPPCRKVIPVLAECYEKYKSKGLVVVGYTKLYGSYKDDEINKGKVPAEEEKNLIKGFIKRFKMTFPVAIAENSDAFDAYGVSGIPTLVMIDKDGNVVDIAAGSKDKATLEAKIEKLLK